jgi:hypothetical protein
MSAPLYIPSSPTASFNNNPTSSARGTTASYTVPAGKYARVSISISHSYYTSTSFGGNTVQIPTTSNSVFGGTGIVSAFDVWMKAGEILTLANTNTNGTATITGSTSNSVLASLSAIANTITAITVNGSLWRNITSRASYSCVASYPTLGTFQTSSMTITTTCDSTLGWWAQEYTV